MDQFDYVLVGGGLQNCLLALALAQRRPECSVALVERDRRLGGNHTWCFHSADVAASDTALVEPLVVKRWSGYSVHFPRSERHLDEPYSALTSERLHDVVTELATTSSRLKLFLGEDVSAIEAGSVTTTSGTRLYGKLVVDARGPDASDPDRIAGFQKFVGLELEVLPGSAPLLPTLMDARVPQTDGFRFFYVLPLAPARVLVEDTYFSDSPELDCAALRTEIFRYADSIGLRVQGVVREESGVLPLPRRLSSLKDSSVRPIAGGYQGGWFHPTTGYSFPLAVRLASLISEASPANLSEKLQRLSSMRDRQQRFCGLLNRLLFDAFEPAQRLHVFERFYRLPAATLRRFYALTLSPADQVRILCGRPPEGFRTSRLFGQQHARVFPKRTFGENL